MAGRLVHRPKCLGKTACPGLKFDEVPTKLACALHGDRSQRIRRPLLSICMPPRPDWRTIGDLHSDRSLDPLPTGHPIEFKLEFLIDLESEAARLRAAAEAKPMRLPVNRRVDESHHAVTTDGLSVWYTIQVSAHSRIQEAIFERSDRMPSDEECQLWLDLLIVGAQATETPSLPGAMTRRFEAFERNPNLEAPIA